MGEAGRRRVEAHFSWDRIADRTMTVYGEAIDAFGAHRGAPLK
jgi:glycosyltransferase involved in cell wall biosynthesis